MLQHCNDIIYVSAIIHLINDSQTNKFITLRHNKNIILVTHIYTICMYDNHNLSKLWAIITFMIIGIKIKFVKTKG